MMFKDRLKKVKVDGQPVKVKENTTTNEILSKVDRGSGDYTLATEGKDGSSEMIPSGSRVQTRNGQKFESSLNGIGG